MEPQQILTTTQLGDEDTIGPDGQTGPPEAQSQSIVQQDNSQLKIKTDVQELQLSQKKVFQLEFQDSHLSPALSLLPLIPGLEHSVTEYSFFQQGDPEFAPLRAFPDVSMVSERLRFLIHDGTTNSSEQSSLSQHPLSQGTLLSDEGASSNFSPSQHDTQRKLSSGDSIETKLETVYNLTDRNKVGIHKDETIFLHKDISMQDPQADQRQVGMQSSSSSSVSSESLTSMKSTGFCPDQLRQTEDNMFERQGPPGEASPSQQQKNHKEISNITTGSRSTQPDDSSEELHKELQSEVRKLSNFEAHKQPKGLTPTREMITPYLKESQGKRSGKPFSAGSEWVHRDRDLWSLQNQTGSEGSYLGFLPQSQSTPGVFFVPPKLDVKTKLAHLSAIESNIDTLYPSMMGAHSADGRLPDTEDPQEASHKVHSLPILNYLQKVDAWKTKESSKRTPSLEGLALHRLSGVPPKKGEEAGTNTLIQQPSTNQDATQISSSTPSGGSSPRRGEAVGGAPSGLENKGSATPPSASPFGRSQSPSSLGTVVVVADKHQLINTAPENKTTQGLKDTLPPPSTATQPSRFESLGRFSDVSELSSSQDSYTEIKVGPSVGTSSVVSLELDNYAPYWTFKHSAMSPPPPGSKELNIDERIPLYLQNLGIDQTPSKILTPFAPRGPIREPEFSPTDLCTIKGSSGTPSKSTQPSEGSSPHKGEFSMSSILSVDSSLSISLSMDSLGLVSSPSEQVRVKASPPSDTEATRRENRPASCSGPGERSHSSVLIQNSKQDFKSIAVNVSDSDTKSSVRSCDNTDQDAENSFVSTKALSEIRKLLSQAEDMISTPSSTSSSGPNATLLFSDKDIFRPPNTSTSQLQNSSFSSSISTFTGGDLKSHSSPPWAKSSSDSILTSEKQNQSSTGLESLMSSEQPNSPSTQARRTEPEGCSAAPPDKIQTQPSTAASTTQFNAALEEEEEEEKIISSDPGAESRSSFPVCEDTDQGVMSDSSSESSLAIRVAKLLQNESSATMTSSTPSVTDQEEGKAREWMKSKVLEQQRDLLLLDVEDRRHIEEIKKQLLLRNPLKSQGSTDTESSSMASSVQVHRETNPPKPAEIFPTLSIANKQLAVYPDPHTTLQSNLHLDLEARVCAIAAREGITLPTKTPQTLPSISIPTQRNSVTSSPSILTPTSTFALSPALDPLHLAELSTGTSSSSKCLSTSLDESETVPLVQITREPPSAHDESTRKRRDTVGGQGEEPPHTAMQAVDKQDVGTNVQSSSFLAVGQGFRTSHFTLLPKNILASTAHCPGSGAATATLRDSSLTASSPDEGVGSSSPAEWYDGRKPVADRTDVSTIDPRGKGITPASSYPAETPVAVLLPYKPRGSEELFYVPQMEADVCSTNRTNTTMESSHTGSDDAVPPTFSSEVLGDQDPRMDRGIAFRHQEGIYSKRLRTAAVTMADPTHTVDAPAAAERGSPALIQGVKPSSQESSTFTRAPSINLKPSSRDQGTSPIHFPQNKPMELAHDRFHPAHLETVHTETRERECPPPALRQGTSTLDHLWQKFCDQWTKDEARPTSDKDVSLLERLERLSRVIHRTQAAQAAESQEERSSYFPGRTPRKERKEIKWSEHGGVTDRGWEVGGGEAEHPTQLNHPSSSADRDQPDSLSTTSTVDTARLVRAFGADRVRNVNSSSRLGKLYSTINKQREDWRGKEADSSVTLTPSEESVVADSAQTSSSHTFSPQRRPSRPLTAKRAVRAVNKSIQAGELEIIRNGTRRNTRDVGTTFPSPAEARTCGQTSSSSSGAVGGRGGRRVLPKSNSNQKQKKSKRSPSKPYPKSVSWFIPVDNLRSEMRKENRPEKSNTAWFEPYSRTRPWRELLRQRQVRNLNPKKNILSSGLARVSLQEALEIRRPDFISQSKQRVRCLALQAEDRRIQAARNLLFDQLEEPQRLPRPAGTALLRRAVPRKEMIQRSKQIYENLPEVRRRREEERRKAEYQTYRLNAKLYNKRVRNQVLGRRTAWQ